MTANGFTYVDDISIVRLEKSTAQAGATVGAVWDSNIVNQPSTADLFKNLALGHWQVGSFLWDYLGDITENQIINDISAADNQSLVWQCSSNFDNVLSTQTITQNTTKPSKFTVKDNNIVTISNGISLTADTDMVYGGTTISNQVTISGSQEIKNNLVIAGNGTVNFSANSILSIVHFQSNGGWNSVDSIHVEPDRTYRFVVPFKLTDSKTGAINWAVQSNSVCGLNTSNQYPTNSNAAFISSHLKTDLLLNTWYLMVGFVFPAGSTGNTHAGSGIYDLSTSSFVASGTNYCWFSGATSSGHSACQSDATVSGETMVFGFPKIELADGTEQSIGAFGTIGATFGVNINGQITPDNASTYFANGTLGTLQLANNASTMSINAFTNSSTTISAGSTGVIQTITTGVLSTTESVLVVLTCSFLAALNAQASYYTMSLTTNGTTLYSGTGGTSTCFNITYTVPANTSATFNLNVTSVVNLPPNTGGQVSFTNRSITAIGLKR